MAQSIEGESHPEYREISDDEFRAVLRGRPDAPRLFVRVDEADHYHAVMDAAFPKE